MRDSNTRIFSAIILSLGFHAAILGMDLNLQPTGRFTVKQKRVTLTLAPRKVVRQRFVAMPQPEKVVTPKIAKRKVQPVLTKKRKPVLPQPMETVTAVVQEVPAPVVIEEKESIKPQGQFDETVVEESGSDAQSILVEAIPLYKENPPPKYPSLARRRRHEGTVVLNVHVNEKGLAGEVRLQETSGYSVLDKAALKAVKSWLFEPGKRGEVSIDMWVLVPVRFELR